ncbi:hypothetical protein [Vibrio parahaemolyticus]|uniref:hypothetical protein n=1 Tax=Vibrio parahaemolyticus TaxID=670 RepID=UPI002B212843|nr:hypothetical protein [Vibrio parahaemolyticus]MEA5295183.1 hypothetical protein [Vibrio parahaemolyticus]
MDGNIKQILDLIDQAVKRLVPPVVMFVAAALLVKGLSNPEANQYLFYFLIILLCIGAIGYLFLSGYEAIQTLKKLPIKQWQMAIISFHFHFHFILVYVVLVVAAMKFGLDKIPTT